jgi:hypothetical protein
MAMGRRKSKQSELWVTAKEITKPVLHPFYATVNEVLCTTRAAHGGRTCAGGTTF